MKNEGHYVECGWSCSKCGQEGTVSAFGYIDELRAATAQRHQGDTRSRCVAGCLYRAWSEATMDEHQALPAGATPSEQGKAESAQRFSSSTLPLREAITAIQPALDEVQCRMLKFHPHGPVYRELADLKRALEALRDADELASTLRDVPASSCGVTIGTAIGTCRAQAERDAAALTPPPDARHQQLIARVKAIGLRAHAYACSWRVVGQPCDCGLAEMLEAGSPAFTDLLPAFQRFAREQADKMDAAALTPAPSNSVTAESRDEMLQKLGPLAPVAEELLHRMATEAPVLPPIECVHCGHLSYRGGPCPSCSHPNPGVR